jgi:uncharacterized protein (TIGR00730 family)
MSRRISQPFEGAGARLDAAGNAMPHAGMGEIRNICVYCGSSTGTEPAFARAARRFGEILAQNHIGLVYGGGSGGLMGALADAALAQGGMITGVIPDFLKSRERMFKGAHEIIVTRDMHERKRIMFERADAFVALPGGIGTLEELVEQLTWAQLGRHKKPILLANIKGFWNSLIDVFDHMDRSGYIYAGGRLNYLIVDEVEQILPALRAAAAPVSEAEKAGEPETVKRL